MADSPPRRIGQLTPRALHSPPQRHHPDPAAPRDMIRKMPNVAVAPRDPQAEPDKDDSGRSLNVSGPSDHAAAVQAAITEAARSHVPHPTTGNL